MESRMGQVEANIAGLRGDLADHVRELGGQKVTLEDQINTEFAKHKLMMVEIIEGAREEFGDLKTGLTTLYKETEKAIGELNKKVDEKMGEPDDRRCSGGNMNKGYLPMKSMVPKAFTNQEEEWRQWQEDVMDYFDNVNPGMRKFLMEVEAQVDPISDKWIEDKVQEHGTKVAGDKVQVWRALKNLTDGEARKVVNSVRSEDGFRAWQKLHMRFGPSLASQQGVVLMELSGMVSKPAKTPAETRALITEMERRVKRVEDITGEEIGEGHAKSVLVGILDPTTRQHTAMHHGNKSTYEQLKKIVLEFVNNVARKDDSAMQVGRVSADDDGDTKHEGTEHEEDYLAAVGGWQQCYKCLGYGHLARECPSKGKGKGGEAGAPGGYGKAKGKGWAEMPKGKGKGGDKGSGKGKGKKGPMYGSCWTCGGNHFAADCPTKGGGKGGKGINAMEEHWYSDENHQPSVRVLSHLKTVNKTQDKGDDEAQGWTLVDFVKNKKRQGQAKQDRRRRKDILEGQASKSESGQLRIFQTIEPEGVNAVKGAGQWEEIEMAVDSGASETVIGEDMLQGVETKEGPASRRGVQYEVANGVRIPNLGEKTFKGHTEEGFQRNLKAQVCEVNKALLSVNKMVQAGNRVVFDNTGSYIEDKFTHEKIWLEEKGGMYMLRMWVRNEVF